MTEYDATNKIGKYFVWIAWLIALILLFFVFQKMLDEQWNPNSQPNAYLNENGKAEVHLQQNRQGHYLTKGAINEQTVTFLLDTGATHVSIPAHIADRLNLPNQGTYRVETANGAINVYQTTIEQLSIGNIFLYNVAANINPSMQSSEILLGMSALKRVEFRQTGKKLIISEQ